MAKILVIDDSTDLLELFSILFKMHGYEVETAASGKTLENTLSRFAPHLIILDVNFNGLNGRELCKQIRANNTTKHIPIILISASPQLLKNYEECEANDAIEKPFDIKNVIEKVKMQLANTYEAK